MDAAKTIVGAVWARNPPFDLLISKQPIITA
jgi:hypothetical protein